MKILMIMTKKLDFGGIENYVMMHYRHLIKNGHNVDFIIHSNEKGFYEDEILKNSSNIYRLPRMGKHPFMYISQLKKIIKNNNYDIVHRHASASTMWVDLWIAKKCKVKVRIAHSHNACWKHKIIHNLFKPLLFHYATDFFACSSAAGKWMFGNKEYNIMKNGINIDKFKYDYFKRNILRKEYLVDDKVVLCNVARLSPEKNQKFLIDLVHKLDAKKFELFFVGNGTIRKELEDYACLSSYSNIHFLGSKENVNDFLSMSDVFLLPSFSEGLGISLIEAQCSGLPCIASVNVPNEADLGLIKFEELDLSKWEKCLYNIEINKNRENSIQLIIDNEYSDYQVTKKVEEYYLKCLQKY